METKTKTRLFNVCTIYRAKHGGDLRSMYWHSIAPHTLDRARIARERCALVGDTFYALVENETVTSIAEPLTHGDLHDLHCLGVKAFSVRAMVDIISLERASK